MPIVVLLCLIGWTLAFYGSKKEMNKTKTSKKEEPTFAVFLPLLENNLSTESKCFEFLDDHNITKNC